MLAVGKSNIMMQAIKQQFKKDHVLTIGVEFGSKFFHLDGKTYRVQIWDTVRIYNLNFLFFLNPEFDLLIFYKGYLFSLNTNYISTVKEFKNIFFIKLLKFDIFIFLK